MKRILNSALATSVAAALATMLAASTASAALSFTPLTLINSWSAYAGGYTPAVALDSKGIVHLRGGIKRTGGSSFTAFNLPATFRPNKIVYVITNLCGAAPGRLVVHPDGDVIADWGTASADATCFTSLDGVTFGR